MLLNTELCYWIVSTHQWQSICIRAVFPKMSDIFSIKNRHTQQFLPNRTDSAQHRLSAVLQRAARISCTPTLPILSCPRLLTPARNYI